MFRITDRAISPLKGHFESATRRLPAAHIEAQRHAVAHLHARAQAAAEESGLDPEPVQMAWDQGTAHVVIANSEAGNRLFAHEYGSGDESPGYVIRGAISAARPQAQAIYHQHLSLGIGL